MDDTLKEDLEAFKLASDAEKDQREAMLDDLKFVKLGEQWPQEVIEKRAKEGRPCLTINRLPAFAKQVTNDARQNRPAIKTHPIGDKADKETAEILQGLIRNIEYSSNADVAYDTGLDFAVNCGIGYWTINLAYADADTFDKDIRIERVSNPFSVYGDPASTAADSSDWNRAYVTDKLTEKEFKKRWKDASKANFEADDSRDSDWYEEEMIRIAEVWVREKKAVKLLKLTDGSLMMEPEYLKLKEILDARQITVEGDRPSEMFVVSQRIISGADILEENDWPGKYIPIVPCYGDEVCIEGKRSWQSLFHFAKDAQRNYNYWRTATTELIALAPKTPFIGPAGAFDDDANWNTANTDSHPYLTYKGAVRPERQPFAGPPAGALQEALNASDDLKNIMGLHDASLGAQSNETSGRAIMARQREGDVATFNFIDNQNRAIRHTGRILVDLIPKVYDVPRIIRVIKEDGSNYSVPVNQPIIEKPLQPNEDGSPPQPGQPPQYQPVDPEQEAEVQGLIKTFDLAAGKYDVTCESGPSFTTRREEASQQMAEFIRSVPNIPPKAIGMLVKNLDWPGADDFAKAISGDKDPQVQQAEQAIQQLQGQLQQMQKELQDKSQELQIKYLEAETKRLAVTKGETPQSEPDHSFEQWKIEFDAQEKRILENMRAEAAERLELLKQQNAAIVGQETMEQLDEDGNPMPDPIMSAIDSLTQGIAAIHERVTTPPSIDIVKDEGGNVLGRMYNGVFQPARKGPDGRIIGV